VTCGLGLGYTTRAFFALIARWDLFFSPLLFFRSLIDRRSHVIRRLSGCRRRRRGRKRPSRSHLSRSFPLLSTEGEKGGKGTYYTTAQKGQKMAKRVLLGSSYGIPFVAFFAKDVIDIYFAPDRWTVFNRCNHSSSCYFVAFVLGPKAKGGRRETFTETCVWKILFPGLKGQQYACI